ncbi:MAG: UDP-4-amino-4,6-dideoxy-N-acetyl-beta-L-altrosamine transaminase [Candidatus Marinimicrobia bacterium]|nr:UDP-4-amino-4,6-dideoxy-N-acetyl-beta-L-altrosamine transaminase [Candidatus Neomarinimicrobiota bacterium]|tara:strand:- start:3222 stop:4376 length:1155 start_codon:yes stop_codon:yes gene_type:complete
MNIPFHRPNIPKNLDKINTDSIKSGWLTTGSQVLKFEKKLSNYLLYKHVVALSSCTAGLHLALVAKEFNKGDKFLAPALTFVSTIECGEYLGMSPVLIDCKKDGFLIDLNFIEDKIKRDTNIKAIIPMHYGGELNDMENIISIAEKYGLFVLEDAAHAVENSFNNKKEEYLNHAVAFSFYANKNITSAGEGGALATSNKKLAQKIKKLSLHGITKDGWNRYKKFGKWEYDITELGFKYNMTDVSASFALWQWQFLKKWQSSRKDIVKRYSKGLKDVEGIILPNIDQKHAMHLYVIRLNLELWQISRNDFIDKLNKKGIGLAVHYKPIHHLSFYKKMYKLKNDDYPRANELFNSIVSLPIYPLLTDKEVDYIIDCIKELFVKYSI